MFRCSRLAVILSRKRKSGEVSEALRKRENSEELREADNGERTQRWNTLKIEENKIK